MSNKLFQGTFETRDGEHEYTQYQHVLAPTVEKARRHFEAEMAEFYQDCVLVWVEEFTEMTVGVIGGGWGHVDLEVRSE